MANQREEAVEIYSGENKASNTLWAVQCGRAELTSNLWRVHAGLTWILQHELSEQWKKLQNDGCMRLCAAVTESKQGRRDDTLQKLIAFPNAQFGKKPTTYKILFTTFVNAVKCLLHNFPTNTGLWQNHESCFLRGVLSRTLPGEMTQQSFSKAFAKLNIPAISVQ